MLHATHHDKVDKGDSVGMDTKHSHGAQHVCNDTTDSEQDDNGCPKIETQEENAYNEYSTCRSRGIACKEEEEEWESWKEKERRQEKEGEVRGGEGM